MAAIKALQQWCKIQCDGYRDVNIINMTTSFRDGLAFCALIHKHRPDLINYGSLTKENVYDNNNLAFRVAEDHLGIPALLDAEDMVALRIPDRLSILTYVSQYYNYFNGRAPSGGVGGVKRPAEGSKEEPSGKKNLPVIAKPLPCKLAVENRPPLAVTVTAPSGHLPKLPPAANKPLPQKEVLVESSNNTGTISSTCVVCKHHVHLVQRHLVDGRLYHRSCFKCNECSKTLLSGAYKGGPEPGSFTCTAHQSSQNNCKMTAPSDAAPSPHPVSVLSAPIRTEAKPVAPPSATSNWTTSAQKTQAARQRFFTSAPAVADPTPSSRRAPAAPAAPESRGPSRDLEEKKPDLMTGNLSEGNCNNNNISTHPRLWETGHWAPPADVSRSKRDVNGYGTAENKPVEPSMRLKTTSNKEALWVKSTQRESLNNFSSRIKDVERSETPADWRSMLRPVPNGQGLNSEMEANPCPTLPQNDTTTNPLSPQTGVCSGTPAISHENARTPSRKPQNVCGRWDFTNGSGSPSTNASTPESALPKGRSFCVPAERIQQELQEIEEHLSDLEKQGVEMEKHLRHCEAEGEEDALDSLMVDWFNLIQTKQACIRRESELVYIAKTQDLEEQQPGVEGELRRLMDTPEHLKTSVDRQREEELMERLMEIVNDRNAIVVVLDEDRLREEEEDQQLHQMMEKLGKRRGKSKKKSPIKKLFRRLSKKDSMKN
ncbi:MICAL-like protein 2a [Anguilla anguilla]|uniref:MICAL-like protein 2a n=1 Tax=Anguilla anguilla TaxID=7936 RepID=UPI0015AF9B44|nr:MICAL-like protein 2a [Anguilla anguilla]